MWQGRGRRKWCGKGDLDLETVHGGCRVCLNTIQVTPERIEVRGEGAVASRGLEHRRLREVLVCLGVLYVELSGGYLAGGACAV